MGQYTRLDNEDYMFNGTNYKFQLGNKFYMSATLKQLVIIEGEITIDEFIEKYHQYITNKKIKIEQLKLNHESRRARMNKLTSNVQTSNIFTVNKISPRLERSPQSYEPAPIKIDYNIYKVGAKVYHENYGYGSITSIDNYTNKAVIEFDSGMKERFNIKNLYKSDRFTIV